MARNAGPDVAICCRYVTKPAKRQAAADLFELAGIPKRVEGTWMDAEPNRFAGTGMPLCSLNTWRALANPVSGVGTDRNYGSYTQYPSLLSNNASHDLSDEGITTVSVGMLYFL
jgi:hypothetical protein